MKDEDAEDQVNDNENSANNNSEKVDHVNFEPTNERPISNRKSNRSNEKVHPNPLESDREQDTGRTNDKLISNMADYPQRQNKRSNVIEQIEMFATMIQR